MIPVEKLAEIRALLAAGKLSQRAIARKVGVSRGTVAAIAGRKRPCYDRKLAEDTSTGPRRRGRCPVCRSIVVLPCLACLVRHLLAAGALRPLPTTPDEPLRLELRPPEWRRYLQVRLRRETRHEI